MMVVSEPPAAGGVPLEFAASRRHDAASRLFALNPRALSLGIGLADADLDEPTKWAFHVLSDRTIILPEAVEAPFPPELLDVPVIVREVSRDSDGATGEAFFTAQALSAGQQPPASACEQRPVRPLVCGLQVENTAQTSGPGSTGCFVVAPGGGVALLSNNHVLAGSNRASVGEKIFQPGAGHPVGRLLDYPPLLTVPQANTADVALAALNTGTAYGNGFHPARQLWPLTRFLTDAEITQLVAQKEDVFKVGLNGYAEGRVDQILVQTRPIDYRHLGYCRFVDVVVTLHRTNAQKAVAAPGDSGAPIFDQSGGVVGIHFAGGFDKKRQEQVSWACVGSGIETALQTVFGNGFSLELAPGGLA